MWGQCVLFAILFAVSRSSPIENISKGDDEQDGPITLYDSANNECFKATLNMDILLNDDDDMMSITNSIASREDYHILHVNTSNPIGLCPFEEGEIVPGGPSLTGPVLYFEWNQTSHFYKVLLLWKHENDAYYLDTVAVDLIIPHRRHPERMKHLQAKITDMKLFGIEFGQSLTINTPEERQIVFDSKDRACFVFESVKMELLDTMQGVSVVMLACVVVAAAIMMLAGAFFWYHGTRDQRIKKLSRQQDIFNTIEVLPKQYVV